MQTESVGIRINYSNVETLRKWLSTHNAIDQSLTFAKEKDFLTIPLTLSEKDARKLLSAYGKEIKFEIGTYKFKEKDSRPRNLFEAVEESIPSTHHEFIPKSYDIIGDIVIVDIPEEISKYNEIIGKSLHDLFPSINTVYRKASSVSGEYRIRELELIAGVEKCETIHLEYGVKIYVNVCETYFSPRLGEEHKKVADSVKSNEHIVDLFTGVGSFPLHIAKRHKTTVFAIDINKSAIECLKKSIQNNKFKGTIHPIHGDCRKAIKTIPKADRVIMNLPSKSLEYVSIACEILKPGGILYFYNFIPEGCTMEENFEELSKELAKSRWKINELLDFRKIRDSAPREIQACLEVSITPLSE